MNTTLSPSVPPAPLPSPERITELQAALADVRARIIAASNSPRRTATLVAVSKYKSTTDIRACYEAGQRDFGENYSQELVEKASVLPRDMRWHFIGTVQSNKAKALAGMPLKFKSPPLSFCCYFYS
jgi:PLP dependent protein